MRGGVPSRPQASGRRAAQTCCKAAIRGSTSGATARSSLTFVSNAALAAGVGERFGLQKTLSAVQGIRGVTKAHMVHNSLLPKMEIDPQTYAVRADGVLLTCEPATRLPMTQRYFLF